MKTWATFMFRHRNNRINKMRIPCVILDLVEEEVVLLLVQLAKGGARLTIAAHGSGQLTPVIRRLIENQLERAHDAGYRGQELLRRSDMTPEEMERRLRQLDEQREARRRAIAEDLDFAAYLLMEKQYELALPKCQLMLQMWKWKRATHRLTRRKQAKDKERRRMLVGAEKCRAGRRKTRRGKTTEGGKKHSRWKGRKQGQLQQQLLLQSRRLHLP
eukprot:g536.t1